MNKVILKDLVLLSSFAGMVFGLIACVPYISGFALFGVLFLAAPVVILLLIMSGRADLTTPKNSIISGALTGFFANITFSFTYSIIVALLYITIKFTTNYFLTAMIINSPIWLLVLIILFVGVLTATTNAFSAFLTYYIINLIRDIYEKKHLGEDK